MNHSPEPWKIGRSSASWMDGDNDNATILDANNAEVIPPVSGTEDSYPPDLSTEDMARIVACVNACAGIQDWAMPAVAFLLRSIRHPDEISVEISGLDVESAMKIKGARVSSVGGHHFLTIYAPE